MSLSVSGLVSGLDVDSIISQLLALQQRPILKLQQREADYQVMLSAYGGLQGALSSFKTAMENLDDASDFDSFSATSSDTDLFTASASASAAAGTHDITVQQLAEVHKLKSAAFGETEEVLQFAVDATNNKIDFKENGGAELTATITSGTYTVSELEAEIESRLETASANSIDYSVSYDSSTKKFTIKENGSILTQLDLLWATGTNSATSAASILGFDSADDTGALEYASDSEVAGTIHLEIGNQFTIGATNNKINFKEDGGAELTATIASGTYTISELESAVKTALDAAGSVTYTVSYDNAAQKFTIDDNGTLAQLDILWKTGTNGSEGTDTSAASILGFSDSADDTGALEYTGDNEVGVVVDILISAADTIQDVADAINDANTGVQAAAIFDGTDYYLTLSAKNSGDANVINLMVTDTDGSNTDTNGLSRLVYHKGGTENLTETQAAKNSIITVDGVANINRDTNTIDDVVEGVTITLKSAPAAPDNEGALTVSRNTSAVVSQINSFAGAYNSLLDFFSVSQTYDRDTGKSGVLFGDGTTNMISNRLRNLVTNTVPDVTEFSRLADMGIGSNKGYLEVDSTELNNALDHHFEDLVQFFTQTTEGSEGFAVRMVDALDGMIDSDDGIIAAKKDGIQSSIDDIHERVERIQRRLAAWETRTRAEFQALEVLLANYQVTGDYLNQQLASLQNLNKYISSRG
ncbi:MAG: flagellar filament capping protein FliD [Desulfobacterales bacterium]|nr:flagellar filament capping protein FliD [Desulfobacterales bacterium]